LSEGLAAVGARVGAFFGRGAVGVAVRRVEIRELTIIYIHIHKIPRRNGEEKEHTHSHILFGRKCVELASEKSGLEREEEIERERERVGAGEKKEI